METVCQNVDATEPEAPVCKRDCFEMMSSATTPPIISTKGLTRFDNITKSPNDGRLYRGLILPNKMKVLLISDHTTDKSAASLDVNVGYMSDPPDIPGLAHFCEHMLFLGTEKYPAENEYGKYLSEHGGASNAATYPDHASYYFDVTPEKLSGALDRFAQFFLNPLFTESATERELNAVNLEHEKNIPNDTWRLDQIDKSIADPNHAYSKFGTGNKETLDVIPKRNGINVRDQLLKFHQEWYSANIMALSILGKESLDELESLTTELFSGVKNLDVELPVWDQHPFSADDFKTKCYIVPIKDIRNLNITFPIPDLREHFRSAPANYISHLLGHEGEGSLLSALKSRGWSNSLVSGRRQAARGFGFFGAYVDLTEEGIKHIDDIVTLTFQYINMMKKEGPVAWIFEEHRDIAAMNFRFKEKSSARSYVNSTVHCLQEYPIPEVLTGPQLVKEWRPDLLEMVMGYLTPENVRISVMAQQYEDIATEKEPWYGTRFKKEKIPEDIIEKWKNAGLNPDLRLPAKNEFIPTNFELKQLEPDASKFPIIIEDTALVRVWFKQDDEFLLPKANLSFDFVSPLVYMDPVNSNLAYMFVQLFCDSLNEYAYSADLAGLKWELSNSKYGMILAVGGYNDKQHVLLEKIIDRMVNFTVDPQRFEIIKENYIRGLKNFDAEQPYQHAVYYLAVLLAENVWTKDELLDATSQLTVDRVQQFIPQILGKMHVECLVHGNVTKSEALDIVKLVESKLIQTLPHVTPLLPRQLVLNREVRLEDGCNFLYQIENKLHKSSCAEVYYQCNLQATESNMLLELLVQIISEPCFNTLRTKEQLGYIVFSGIRRTNGAQGLRVIVQSDKHPQYVEQRIEAFLNSMPGQLVDMSEEEFLRHKDALATKRLEKPKTMSALSALYWAEISTQQYNFDRANVEISYMRTITKDMIIQFFQEAIHNSSPTRHKLSVHVLSTAAGGAGNAETKAAEMDSPSSISETFVNGAYRIHDVMAFKSSQALYPLLKPFIDIPRKGTRSKL
ncbi:insulin-degrading enzyme isoform X2 [Athalia rosae]|uniref:insulin-degrading enzyme isoform X2 n=1 Tax=Athalia rosae TaxID=37344 RepID=UPI0020343A1E|nr:insulin-degrading enzyme isoform X2 [Athalia rosae]